MFKVVSIVNAFNPYDPNATSKSHHIFNCWKSIACMCMRVMTFYEISIHHKMTKCLTIGFKKKKEGVVWLLFFPVASICIIERFRKMTTKSKRKILRSRTFFKMLNNFSKIKTFLIRHSVITALVAATAKIEWWCQIIDMYKFLYR